MAELMPFGVSASEPGPGIPKLDRSGSQPSRPNINEGKLLDFILGETTDALRNRGDFDALQDEYMKRFEALRSVMSLDADIIDRPWRGAANVGVPLEATFVYTILARIIRAVFGLSPILNARPGKPTDLQFIPIIERYMEWELVEEMRAFMDIYQAIEQSLITGSTVGKTTWETETVNYEDNTYHLVDKDGQPMFEPGTQTPMEVDQNHPPVMNQVTGQQFSPQLAQIQKTTTIYDGPKLFLRPTKQIIVSQDATHPDPTRLDWIVDEFWQPFSWFKRKAEEGLISNDVLLKMRGMKDTTRSRQTSSMPKVPGIQPKETTNRFHTYEWHGKFEDDDGEEHEIVTLVLPDEKLLVGWIPNYYYQRTGRRQFIHWCPVPRTHSFYGRGVPEMLRGIRAALDGFLNQGLNRGHLFNNPPVVYNSQTSGFDPNKYKFGTGQSWGLRDINGVKLLELPLSEQNANMREELLFSMAQRLIGAQDFSTAMQKTAGLPTAGAASNTATGISSLIAEANIRFDMIIKIIQEWTHPELARQIFYHNRLNVTGEKVFMVTGSQVSPFSVIGPDAFKANPNFVFKGNTQTSNRELRRQDVIFLYETFLQSKNPFIMQDPDNLMKFTQAILNYSDMPEITLKNPQQLQETIAATQLQQMRINQNAAAIATQLGLGITPEMSPGGPPMNGNGNGQRPPSNGTPQQG